MAIELSVFLFRRHFIMPHPELITFANDRPGYQFFYSVFIIQVFFQIG